MKNITNAFSKYIVALGAIMIDIALYLYLAILIANIVGSAIYNLIYTTSGYEYFFYSNIVTHTIPIILVTSLTIFYRKIFGSKNQYSKAIMFTFLLPMLIGVYYYLDINLNIHDVNNFFIASIMGIYIGIIIGTFYKLKDKSKKKKRKKQK